MSRRDIMANSFLLQFPDYESYLRSHATKEDYIYLENPNLVLKLINLGYRSKTHLLTPDQFQKKLKTLATTMGVYFEYLSQPSNLSYDMDPVVRQFAIREKLMHRKILSTIVFLKSESIGRKEVSAYIDLQTSMDNCRDGYSSATDWPAIFQGKAKLRPQPHHLSYYSVLKNVCIYNDSDNYVVLHDQVHGLMFKHKGDHKIISVNSKNTMYKGNCRRSTHFSNAYGLVVFIDHLIRKKI